MSSRRSQGCSPPCSAFFGARFHNPPKRPTADVRTHERRHRPQSPLVARSVHSAVGVRCLQWLKSAQTGTRRRGLPAGMRRPARNRTYPAAPDDAVFSACGRVPTQTTRPTAPLGQHKLPDGAETPNSADASGAVEAIAHFRNLSEAEPPGVTGSGLCGVLLWISSRPKRQPAVGFCGGDNPEVSLGLGVNSAPQSHARARDRLGLGFGFALSSSPRSCYVGAAASFDDDVVRSVGGGDLDHVAVGVDDRTDRCDRGEHRDAGG